jgi:serine/threonine protein kinase/tetratricopeptide (TPR) repeat protein
MSDGADMAHSLEGLPSVLGAYWQRSQGAAPSSAQSQAEIFAAPFVAELAGAWRSGKTTLVEDLLTAHPELRSQPEVALRLIYEEVCLREEAGDAVPTAEVVRRFPQWQRELEDLFSCYRLMQPHPPAPLFPKVGETLGDLRFLAELGHGARGRVYLAAQCSLADRPLVVKINPLAGCEHLTLARLQHTHIVPLYQVQEFAERRLQALCMPYLGGTNLACLLKALPSQPEERHTGRQLLDILELAQHSSPVPLPGKGSALKFLAQASYVEAVSWMGACLADALHYAHERGVVHLDLKPANVLLAADGQPMLLDFHLAREPLRPDTPAPDWLGGTPEYMSPEQRAALAAVKQGEPIRAAVDGRSDVYSLGALLYEAFSGAPAPVAGTPTRLDRRHPAVSVGLADIVQHCLAPDPSQRYADAADLARDLRQHLADLPLQGVANRSLSERWRKWRRRRPHVLALTAMLLVVLGIILAAALALRNQLESYRGRRLRDTERAVRAALVDGQDQLQRQHHAEARRTLERGLALARSLPESEDLTRSLEQRVRQARRAEEAQELNRLAEQVRFLAAADAAPPTKLLQDLDAHCATIWAGRGRILERGGAQLGSEMEQRVSTDLLDLAILWANLHVQAAPAERTAQARQESLAVLEQAEALFGPSPGLSLERRTQAEALGWSQAAHMEADRARGLASRTASEHDALGRIFLRSGDLQSAAAEFQRALDLRPQDFWPNFHQGICAYRLQRYQEAAAAFQVCIALAPGCAQCFYNRALTYVQLGESARALEDYNRALDLDPTMAAAALNRGLLHYQQQHYTEASADLLRAQDLGADPATVQFNLALVQLACKDTAAALASLERVLKQKPGHREAKELKSQLLRSRGRAGSG